MSSEASDKISPSGWSRFRILFALLLALGPCVLFLASSSSLTPPISLRSGLCVPAALKGCDGGMPARSQLQGDITARICSVLKNASSVLIFGTGFDSPAWVRNGPAELVFLEHHASWIDMQPAEVQERTYVVEYTTALGRPIWWPWVPMPDPPYFSSFLASLPARVRSRQWDVILVDSPEGYDWRNPGRSQSVFAARALLRKGGLVFVDDHDRRPERHFVKEFFAGFQQQVFDNGHGGRTVALC